MQRRTLTSWYDLHSWTGVLAALFVFAVCCSGTVALFKDEIRKWERPDLRLALPAETSMDAAFRTALDEANKALRPGEQITQLTHYRPGLTHPFHEIVFYLESETGEEGRLIGPFYVHPQTYETLPPGGHNLARFHRDFHTNLNMSGRIGRYIVGVSGLLMLLSALTGIFLHRHMIKELFTFRPDRSHRLLWTDMHKVLGLWGLPFHVMISFTGALLGLAGLLTTLLAFIAFDGDRARATESLIGAPPVLSGTKAAPANIDAMLRHAEAAQPNWHARGYFVQDYGDARAPLTVFGRTTDRLSNGDSYIYLAGSGAYFGKRALDDTWAGRLYEAMSPLHYATFGNYLVKLLYAVLGIGACLLTVSGMMIWIVRREQRAPKGTRLTRLRALTAGIAAGQVLAVAASFWANKLLPLGPDMYWKVGGVFFAVWVLATCFALLRRNDIMTWRILLLSAGGLFAGIAPLNALTTGGGLVHTLAARDWPIALVDLICLATGLLLVFAAARLTARKPVPPFAKAAG